MKFTNITLASVSTDTKVETLGIVLDQTLAKIEDKVSNIAKLEGPQGIKGDKGDKGATGVGVTGKDGKAGKDGSDGKDGKDGTDGSSGVSVVNASVALDGSLVLELSNGKEIDVGEVVGPAGKSGVNGINGLKGDSGTAFTSGTVQLDFGSSNKTAEVVVIDVATVLSSSKVMAALRLEATVDHPVDDLQFDPIRVAVKNLVAGVGFTIFGAMDNASANGLYKVDWFLSN